MHPPPSIEDAFLAYRTTRDPAALAKVYDGASARLLSVAIHLCKSPSAAEDVVQDTFLLALENPDRWDETKPLLPWLLGILSNRVRQVDGLSRRSIDPARLLVPDSSDPQEDYEAAELLAQVDDAITHLPQPYRGVVLLRLRNGLSPADISIALGRNPNTVRTQLARGVEMLRKVLPGSVAVLLAGTVAPAAGHAAARQVVLRRAVEIHDRMRALRRTAVLRRAITVLAAAGIAAALAWGLWTRQPATVPAPAATAGITPPTESATAPAATPRDEPDPSRTSERVQSVAAGTATVTVLARAVGLPAATVQLEPIRDPRVFVHNYSRPFGNWQSIVSARPLSRDQWRHGTTADNGRCTFADLPPGYWVCRSLGIDKLFRVQPGQHSDLRIDAPENTTILHGVVLARDGAPIPDAPIWKLNRRIRSASVIVAHSDQHGRFSAAVCPLATLGAFHPGLAPVAVTVPQARGSQQRHVVLQFREAGAQLTGRVLDASGRPRAGAVVEIGQVSDLGAAWATEHPKVLARMHRTITDSRGRYAFPSLVPGRTVVRARSRAHGVARHAIDLPAGQPTEQDLQLPAAATLSGRVRNANGEPAEGVWIRIGTPEEFAQCATVTDAHGRFELAGISPGRCVVAASDLRGGFARADLTVAAGARLSWNADLLPDNLTIAGRVTDARGEPFAGAWVAHRRNDGFDLQQLGADARFSFVIAERGAEAPGSLQVFARDPRNARGAPVGEPIAAVPHVVADATLHEIRVPDPVPGGSLRGKVVMQAGGPVRWPCRLAGSRGARRWHVDLTPSPDGAFQVDGLQQGRYRLHVDAPQPRSFGSIEVTARGVADLGIVRVPGSAAHSERHLRRFALLFPDRTTGTDALIIEAFDEHGWRVNHKQHAACEHGAPNVFLSLPAGEVRIRATTGTGLIAERTLQVDPAVPTRRAVLLEFARR